MTPWTRDTPPPRPPIGAGGWLLILLRGAVLGLVTYGGLVVVLLLRLIERPLFAPRRPITPWITRLVCIAAFPVADIRRRVIGQPLTGHGAFVANHSSWLDIFALNSSTLLYFVAKSEVAGWAGIGWLARATGTVFITRNASEARAQKQLFEQRLAMGHRLLFFPEGTSSDGLRVLPFKSSLFAAFLDRNLPADFAIQPVTVAWQAPEQEDASLYGWWGDMEFGSHFATVMSRPRQGTVAVTFHTPLRVADFPNRKALALACENAVRSALPTPHPARIPSAPVPAPREGHPDAGPDQG